MEEKEFILIQIASNICAIDSSSIIEIINESYIYPIPKLSRKIRGFIKYKSQICPILQFPMKILDESISSSPLIRTTKYPKIVILPFENEVFGILLDNVIHILHNPEILPIDKHKVASTSTYKNAIVQQIIFDKNNIPILPLNLLIEILFDSAKPTEKVSSYDQSFTEVKVNSNAHLSFDNNKMSNKPRIIPQHIYTLNEQDKILLKINNDDLDTFREMGNMSAGNASNYLSNLIKEKIFLEIPPAQILSFKEIQTVISKPHEGRICANFTSIRGEIPANLIFLLEKDSLNSLWLESEEEKRPSAVFNINKIMKEMIQIYLEGINDFLSYQLHSDHQVIHEYLKSIQEEDIKFFLRNDLNKQILIHTGIHLNKEKSISGHFFLCIEPAIGQLILSRVENLW